MNKPNINPLDRAKGLIQIVHDFEFVALNLGLGYTELANMSYDEKYDYMCTRVKKLSDRGYGGVCLNTGFRQYLEDDKDIELIMSIARYAKSLGMAVWIYDEQYYPSGGAGGATLIDRPELEALGLALVKRELETSSRVPVRIASPYGHSEMKHAVAVPVVDGKPAYADALDISDKRDLSGGLCAYLPEGRWQVYAFFYRAIYECSHYLDSFRASRRYINVFDRRATERFYDVTFTEGYKKHCERLGDLVDAVFTDEPNFTFYVEVDPNKAKTRYNSHSIYEPGDPEVVAYPYIPWTTDMVERYRDSYGADIVPLLPYLFEECEGAADVRGRFYSLTSELLRRGFPKYYRERLEEEGVLLGGHWLWEEALDNQPKGFGDIIAQLAELSIPGCDLLYSAPDKLRYAIALRLASSAAHLAGKDRVMIEASNMVDKDQTMSLKRLKGAAAMMFAHGINLITSYYGEDILPPDEMAEYAYFVSAMSSLFSGGESINDTLLYYPYLQLAERTRPSVLSGPPTSDADCFGVAALCEELIKRQVGFDIVNLSYLGEARTENGCLVLKNGKRFSKLVLPAMDSADPGLARIVEMAQSAGVRIYSPRAKIDGLGAAPMPIEDISPSEVYPLFKHPLVLMYRYKLPDHELILLVNSGESSEDITLALPEGGSYLEMLPESYSTKSIDCAAVDGRDRLMLSIEPLGYRIIVKY